MTARPPAPQRQVDANRAAMNVATRDRPNGREPLQESWPNGALAGRFPIQTVLGHLRAELAAIVPPPARDLRIADDARVPVPERDRRHATQIIAIEGWLVRAGPRPKELLPEASELSLWRGGAGPPVGGRKTQHGRWRRRRFRARRRRRVVRGGVIEGSGRPRARRLVFAGRQRAHERQRRFERG